MHGTNVKKKTFRFSKNIQYHIFLKMKMRLVGSKMFHADRQTDRYADRTGETDRNDEANSRFSQICANARKSYDRHS